MREVDEALYAALSADAALLALAPGGVHHGKAPEGTGFPHVVFQQISGPEEYTFTRRVASFLVYQVKCVASGDNQVPAKQAMERVDVLLTDQPLSLATLDHKRTRRRATFDLPEESEGMTYQHVGAEFEVVVG